MADTGADQMVVTRQGDVQIIEFVARSLVDQMAIEQVRREIERLVDGSGHPKLVISLSNLQQVSSALLGVFISVHRKVQELKGEMRLAAVPPPVMEVFKLTRLDKLLRIYPTAGEAVKKF